MRRIWTIVLILLATVVSAQTHNKQMNDEQAIRTLYERMYAAMVAKDEAVLREVHADDFVLIHMTGMCQPKTQYIRAIMDGTLNYFSAETENLHIDIHGDVATLTGHSCVNAAVFGGGCHTWRLSLSMRLRKENDTWRFTRSEASTY